MQTESANPVGIFLLGAPGSGKDYVLNNIFSRFDLTEVQIDHILNGAASELFEGKKNIVINGALDEEKIAVAIQLLEGYDFDFVHVSVTNKVSRLRNSLRENPLPENKRLEKWYRAEKLAEKFDAFNFNNSINLNESSEFEKVFFADQITKLLERVTALGLEINEETEPKAFSVIKEKYFPPVRKDKESGLPKKYVAGLSSSTAKARKAHWKKMSKLSDKDSRAYEPAPGDATAKTKPSKHTLAVRKMMDEQIEGDLKKPHTVENIAKKHNVDVQVILKALEAGKKVEREHTKDDETAETIALAHLWERPDYYKMLKQMEAKDVIVMNKSKQLGDAERYGLEKAKINLATSKVQESDSSLSAKAAKSGISVGTLRKVYKRGVAAWNSGHRPGTTPQQWGHARVNSYINKGKTYHTADKDLREDADIDELFEMQLVGTDEYRKHAIAMTPGQGEPVDAFPIKNSNKKVDDDKKSKSTNEHTNCGTPNCCGECNGEVSEGNRRSFREFRSETKEVIDATPELKVKRGKATIKRASDYNYTLQGLPVTARFNALETKEPTIKEAVEYHLENQISFTENVFRPGSDMFFEMISEAKNLYKEGKYTPADEWEQDMLETDIGEIAEYEGQMVVLDYPIEEGLEECWKGYTQKGMKKKGDRMVPNCVPVNEEELALSEMDNRTPSGDRREKRANSPEEKTKREKEFQDNLRKAGPDIRKKLGLPEPTVKEESDPTDGKGVGKPWREGGGGAVYVRTSSGGIKKVRFSQSGMKKKFMDPAATRSFVARHHCLSNKDKTSASYWACRYPRFFSNSGKIWW